MPRGRPKKNEAEKETVGTTVRTTLVFDLSKDNHVLVYDYLNSLQRGGKTDAVVNAIIDKATKQHEMQEAQSILKEELQNTIAEEIRSCIPQIVDAVTSSIQKNGIAVAAPASNHSPQNMVQPTILLSGLYGHHIPYILHYADHRRVPLRICTNLTSFRIRYIMTHLAIFHLML